MRKGEKGTEKGKSRKGQEGEKEKRETRKGEEERGKEERKREKRGKKKGRKNEKTKERKKHWSLLLLIPLHSVEHLDAFQHLCFLKGTSRGSRFVSQHREKPWRAPCRLLIRAWPAPWGWQSPGTSSRGKGRCWKQSSVHVNIPRASLKAGSYGNALSSALGNESTLQTSHVCSG